MNRLIKYLLTAAYLSLILSTGHAAEIVMRANTEARDLLGEQTLYIDLYASGVDPTKDGVSYIVAKDVDGAEILYAQTEVYSHSRSEYRIYIRMGDYYLAYGNDANGFYIDSDGKKTDVLNSDDLYLVDCYREVLKSLAFTAETESGAFIKRKMNQDQRTFFDMVCYTAGICAFTPPASWGCAPVAIGCLATYPMATVEEDKPTKIRTGPGAVKPNTDATPNVSVEGGGGGGSDSFLTTDCPTGCICLDSGVVMC